MIYAEPFPSTGNKLFKCNHSFAQKHNMGITGENERAKLNEVSLSFLDSDTNSEEKHISLQK